MGSKVWDNFKKFMQRPFSADMTALDWFLFFGFMIAVAAGWRLILRHINNEDL